MPSASAALASGTRRSGPWRHPLRRQPAEGRSGQMAVDAAEGHDFRRADARHRRRLEVRDLCPDARPRRRGVAILMISSDMEEVIGVSDRMAVMHEGRISGFLERGRVQRRECYAARCRQATSGNGDRAC